MPPIEIPILRRRGLKDTSTDKLVRYFEVKSANVCVSSLSSMLCTYATHFSSLYQNPKNSQRIAKFCSVGELCCWALHFVQTVKPSQHEYICSDEHELKWNLLKGQP